mgnify:CR=1 FL=1
MAKERSIKIIYLAIIVILIILLFVGFFNKNAYASDTGLNKVYTIEEIYNMCEIPEAIRVNPKDYGYQRILGIIDTLDYRLYFICFNNPFDLSKINVVSDAVRYNFEETVRFIEYDTRKKILNYNDEFDNFEYWIAQEPLNETTYNEEFLGRRIIYSSHNIYNSDGTLFFSAVKMRTVMAPIMANLNPEMGKVMKEVVSLIPIGAGLVVSFLGFRKGLRLLSRMLRRA